MRRQSLQQLAQAAGLSDEALGFMATATGGEALLPSAATDSDREDGGHNSNTGQATLRKGHWIPFR